MPRFTGHDIACVRADRVVFRGLDFAVEGGGVLVLRGPNGSGKSSLLRLMAGLLRPAAGEMRWQGDPVGTDPGAHHRRLAYLGHLDAVKAALTVRETAGFWAAVGGADRKAASRALAAMGLDGLGDMPTRLLSAGQRRRLALARILAAPRALWLLDEPATGLDEAGIAALRAAVEAHREGGGMAVVATHGDLGLAGAAELRPGDHAPDPVLGDAFAWTA